jgi:short-subunit dehydrogenase
MAIIASTPDLTDAQDLARVEARLRDDTAIALLVNNAGAAAGRLRVL